VVGKLTLLLDNNFNLTNFAMKKFLDMKKRIFIILLSFFLSFSVSAQKFAYVDTDYILENLEQYNSGQKQIDDLSIEWQEELELLYGNIDKLYRNYQAEQILLTEEMRIAREQEIINKEIEAKELQKKRFGPEGDLEKKKKELIRPIQDKVYNAIQEIAELGKYAIIFDKSSSLLMLFSDPRYDKSDDVLERIQNNY